jgi:hypothetical protein
MKAFAQIRNRIRCLWHCRCSRVRLAERQRIMRPLGVALVLVWSLLAAMDGVSSAASLPTAANSPQSGELRFRRVYFPEGMKEWPKGAEKYLPMEADEFNRLIETIHRGAPGGPGKASIGLVSAQYYARLKTPSMLEGNATLNVSPSTISAMLMTLDPCNLAISRAQWVTSDGAPAILGLSASGKLQALAERSGQMKFDWSLAGQRDVTGDVSFIIELPLSPVNQLRIEVPAGLTPVVDHGVLTDEGPADPSFRRFRVELGGRSACRLRFVRPGSEAARPFAVLASQSAAYDFSLHGVELSVDLNIEAHRHPLPNIVLNLDSSLELVDVSAGEVSLPWEVVAKIADKVRRVAIALPGPLQDGAASLRLRAVAPPLPPGLWKLPRMTFDGVVCRIGSIRLSIPFPLSIDRLELHGCRQTGVAAFVGEQLDFESLASDAAISIAMSQHLTQIQGISATATVLGQGKISSRVATDFRSGDGPVFSLEAAVLPNWVIDSVVSQPTDGLDDWTVESRGEARRLLVRLSRPLTAARRLRLIISARRLYAIPGSNLGVDDVVPLRFLGLSERRSWVDLHTSGLHEIKVSGGEKPRRIDIKDLTAAELDLFAEPPGELLFRDDGDAAGLRLSLESRRPTYSATTRVEAVVGETTLAENYTFSCTPSKTAPVDRLVVHFSRHREVPLKWSILNMDESQFSAHRWPAPQENSAGLTAEEENWDIVFRKPRSAPLEIHAARQTKLSGPTPVCLATLPDATRQEARLVLRDVSPQGIQIKTHRVTPLPAEAVADHISTTHASYQYDPRTEATPQSEPAVVLTTLKRQSPAAWAWDCEIDSEVADNGIGVHVVRYRIENVGCRQIRVSLPPGLLPEDFHGVWVNEKPVATFKEAGPSAGDLSFDLPLGVKNLSVTMQFSTRGSALGTVHRLQPPLPEIGLPTFARNWRLELPPGYEVLQSDRSENGTFSLRRRLGGCLGRNEGELAFNPLRRRDWHTIFVLGKSGDHSTLATEAEGAGWRQVRMNLADGASGVLVVRRAAIDVASWLLFLTVVSLGIWRFSRRPVVLVALAAILGITAIVLPAAISTIASHALLGVILCLVVKRVRPSVASTGELPASCGAEMPSTLTNIIPYGAPLFAAIMFCSQGSAHAGQPTKPPVAHSVFIPVDKNQQPIQGKYYLPEPFFAELYQRAALQADRPQGWMIASALYRAELINDSAQLGYVIDRLTSEFEIRVFNATTRVRIPLRRDEVNLEPGQARLEDRSIQPEWDAAGHALFVDIAEPGNYRLELSLRPAAQPSSQSAALDLAIPRVPTARLELGVPDGGPFLEFPAALGAVRWEDVVSRWTVDLGPCGRLVVRLPDAAPAGGTVVDVDQLSWMKIEPGCVLVDARIKARSAIGSVRRLLLRADSALELLSSAGPAVPTVQDRGGGAFRGYELQLPRSTGSATTCDLHFLWNGEAGVGALHLPQIDVSNARPVRRWLAISVNPALECQSPGARLQEMGVVPEFISNWGATDVSVSPDLAFRLNGNAADWSVTTRLRRAAASGDANVTWTFGGQSVELLFAAQLHAVYGSIFQYCLEAPPSLHVDSLTVLAAGANQAIRWSQEKDGQISVFLGKPLPGRHEFQLRGQMPLPEQRIFPFHRFVCKMLACRTHE